MTIPKLILASFFVMSVAACNKQARPQEVQWLQMYQVKEEPWVLACDKLGTTTHSDLVIAAKAFPGGTWEIFPAKGQPADAVAFYQQAPGETCRALPLSIFKSSWRPE